MLLHSKPNGQLQSFIYPLFRICMGAFMLTHGYPKLMKLLDGGSISFADPFGIGAVPSLVLAVFAEVLCAALLTLGLFTRLAVVPLIVTMAVAAFIQHGDDPFGKKELALVYLVAYALIFAMGSGGISVDRLRGKG